MTNWLAQLHLLDPLDAYQLLSQISETPLALDQACQVCRIDA